MTMIWWWQRLWWRCWWYNHKCNRKWWWPWGRHWASPWGHRWWWWRRWWGRQWASPWGHRGRGCRECTKASRATLTSSLLKTSSWSSASLSSSLFVILPLCIVSSDRSSQYYVLLDRYEVAFQIWGSTLLCYIYLLSGLWNIWHKYQMSNNRNHLVGQLTGMG